MPATLKPVTDPILIGWGRHMAAKGRSPGTIEQRQRYAGLMLAGRHPNTITTEDIELWLSGFDWAPETRRSAIASVRMFFRWWEATHPGQPSPAESLEAPPGSAPCPKPCPDDVLQAAMDRARGDRWWLLRIASATGLRRAELASLTPSMVEGRFLRVRGKGGKVRRVPVPDDVRRWIAGRGEWVFPSPYGGHVHPDAIGRRLTRSLGPPWTAHTLRHRYATTTYASCRNLAVVQKLLGHASLATTERYLATGDEDLLQAVAWTQQPTLRLVG